MTALEPDPLVLPDRRSNRRPTTPRQNATLCSLPIETQEAGAQGDPPRCPCTTRPAIR